MKATASSTARCLGRGGPHRKSFCFEPFSAGELRNSPAPLRGPAALDLQEEGKRAYMYIVMPNLPARRFNSFEW